MSNSATNPPFSDTTASFTSPNPNQNNHLLLHKLEILTKDHAILDKQLRQAKRDYGDTALELADSRQESAELKANFNRLTSEQETLIRELRLEVKQLKHNEQEIKTTFEMLRKKADTASALEAENWVLRGVADAANAAKVAEEKALKEKEIVVMENRKLKLAKESIIESATVRFKAFEKRVAALEACVAIINPTFDSSQGQAAPVSVQETVDHAVVYVDSD